MKVGLPGLPDSLAALAFEPQAHSRGLAHRVKSREIDSIFTNSMSAGYEWRSESEWKFSVLHQTHPSRD